MAIRTHQKKYHRTHCFNNKRAIMEIQFNWIFVFVVGSVILLFFVFVGKSYLNSSEIKLAGKVLQDLDSIMKGASKSSQASTKLEIPRLNLQFTCSAACTTEGCDSVFMLGDTGVNKPTPHEVIFAFSEMESDYLITWTLDWAAPFKVANLLYISSPEIRYVLVYNEAYQGSKAMAEKAYNLMLDNEFLTTSIFSEDELLKTYTDEGQKYVRFVLFYPFSKNLDVEVGDAEYSLVVFVDPNPSFNGKVMFLDAESASKPGKFENTLGYFGKEAMMGAIFSANNDFFKCNMYKGFGNYARVFEVYKRRAQMLSNVQGGCSALYMPFAGLELPSDFTYPLEFKEDDFAKIQAKLQQISATAESVNKNAIFHSCPRLY
jgi:hypothetical protein